MQAKTAVEVMHMIDDIIIISYLIDSEYLLEGRHFSIQYHSRPSHQPPMM